MCHWAKQGRPALVHAICSRLSKQYYICKDLQKDYISQKGSIIFAKTVFYLQK